MNNVRGKKEDNGGEKTKDNNPKSTFKGKKTKENLKKMFDQVYSAFEPLSDVDGESEDEDKGKNISGICFMARGESDSECEDNEVLMHEISKIRDVNVAHDLKNRSSLALGFALHTRTSDELFLSKNLLKKYQIAFHASLMFNMICAKKLKQQHGVLDCSTCTLNKMKLKDALGRVEYMEDIVKTNEVLSRPKCRKSKGVMVDCENCANLKYDVSYLKSSLQRFSDGFGGEEGERVDRGFRLFTAHDRFGQARVQSVRGKWYVLVIVDDFSRYSWVFFMSTKDEAFQHFHGLYLRLDLEFSGSLKII
uniref:Uncharacterized protein n=1 Tax=Oryza sativa subsp. japonica TaxID=39947 RepID=H2KW72_ORYSJ|nr:hypothetical protein LOC_Os11g33946 [Oryza sativa Japonica Group]